MPGYLGAKVPTNSSQTDWVPISYQDVHNKSLVEFKHNEGGVVLDNTYRVYKFEFINVHPATDNVSFEFQANAVQQTGYNETMQTQYQTAYSKEDNASAVAFNEEAGDDQANGTSYQALAVYQGNGLDESLSGELIIYDPSNTTHVKFFTSHISNYVQDNYARSNRVSGYFNGTAGYNNFSFKFSSGNIQHAKIKLFGLAT